jgi:hypothetical protein
MPKVSDLGKGRGKLKHQETGHRMARIAVTGALICGVAAAAVGAGPAYASGATTRYVGATAGRDTGCASPGYKRGSDDLRAGHLADLGRAVAAAVRQ